MISYCDHCKVYHLEFGNLFFRFTEDGFLHFRNYVVGINGTEAARMNHGLMSNRKIFSPAFIGECLFLSDKCGIARVENTCTFTNR